MAHPKRPHAGCRPGAGVSKAVARLARSRQAILAHIEQGAHPPVRGETSDWFARLRNAGSTWWRDHPAHLVLELATPVVSKFAGRCPWWFLGVAAAGGALAARTRPWRLLSASALLAVAKSSQLSRLVLPALSALQRPPP